MSNRRIRSTHSMSSLPSTRIEGELMNGATRRRDNSIAAALISNLRVLPGLDQSQTDTLVSALNRVISHATGAQLKAENAASLIEMGLKYVLRLPMQAYEMVEFWIKENPKLFWFIALSLVGGFPGVPTLILQLLGVASSGFTNGQPLNSITSEIIQSAIGNITASSVSSILQSLGVPGAVAKAASAGVAFAVPAVVDMISQELHRVGLGGLGGAIDSVRSRL